MFVHFVLVKDEHYEVSRVDLKLSLSLVKHKHVPRTVTALFKIRI